MVGSQNQPRDFSSENFLSYDHNLKECLDWKPKSVRRDTCLQHSSILRWHLIGVTEKLRVFDGRVGTIEEASGVEK